MLKGETFELQTFTSDTFALFIDRFMNKKSGVLEGCELSNANNSVTIGEGYFLIKGRFLRVISNVTIDNITNDGYYSLVCEIDLSKTNTVSQFNQGVIKVLTDVSDYPELTQEDITDNGTVYQYEFAQFRVVSGTIQDFADKRIYVDYSKVLQDIETEIGDLESDSNVSFKDDFLLLHRAVTTNPAGAPIPTEQIGTATYYLPTGWTSQNCVVLSIGHSGNIYQTGATGWQITVRITNVIQIEAYYGKSLGNTVQLMTDIVLMKIS